MSVEDERPKDPIAAHAELIGRVTLAWTHVQYIMFLLFTEITRLPPDAAEGIFFSLKADSAQREITLAVADTLLGDTPSLRDRVKITLREIGNLAGQRNAAAHTIWTIEVPSGGFAPIGGVRKHGSLTDDVPTQFRTLEKALMDHARDLGEQLFESMRLRALRGIAQPQSPPPEAS